MTSKKQNFISSWIALLTLALLVAAQQPQLPPAKVVTPELAKPVPQAATTISPQQTPLPVTPGRVTTTLPSPTIVAPAQSRPSLTTTPVAMPTAIAPSLTVPAPGHRTHPPVATTIRAISSVPVNQPIEPMAQPQTTTPAPSQNPAAREPSYVEEKGFKGKVIEVKYRDPSALSNALTNLLSGFKGASIRPSNELKAIIVRDFPENIATIEEAIKRLDVPQAPRSDIDFRIHVLIASNTSAAGDEVPAELNDVVQQMKSTFKYKNYTLMFASTHRTKEGAEGVTNNGVVESKLFNVSVPAGNQIFFSYRMMRIGLSSATSGGSTIQIGEFNFSLRIPLVIGEGAKIQYDNVGFSSPLSLREGERVVVGTTTMGDKGLVVVLSARSVK